MAGKSLSRRILVSHLLLVAGGLAAASVLVFLTVKGIVRTGMTARLETAARIVEPSLAGRLVPGKEGDLQAECVDLGGRTGIRFTVVDREGRVWCDSSSDPSRMDNHASRPEVRAALGGTRGVAVRPSPTLGRESLYLAIPLGDPASPEGALRVSLPYSLLEEGLRMVEVRVLGGGAVLLALGVLLALWSGSSAGGPLRDMAREASTVGSQAGRRVHEPDWKEMAAISREMNRLAALLETLDEERKRDGAARARLEAVIEAMADGVVVTDGEGRVRSLNRAAACFLGIDAAAALGRSLEELTRSFPLHSLLEEALGEEKPLPGPGLPRASVGGGADAPAAEGTEVCLGGGTEQRLLVHAARLHGPEGGALLVMSDVTRLRALERMRQEFVANVSHEIRTPVTSIKGFVETLQDGALEEPAAARRFLGIVHRQAERLNSLVDDLLTLSRLDREEAVGAGLHLEETPLGPIVEEAVELVLPRAEARGIAVRTDVHPNLVARAHPLLVQALANLVENAVKFGPAGSEVVVEAARQEKEVFLTVSDNGPGIAPEHVPRLFERFYRVDLARSREMGGTGLGLAIVRHVVSLHHGRAFVETVPGKGSRFTIALPSPP